MLTPAVDLSMVHCGFADAEEVDSVVFIAVTVVLLHDAVAVDVLAAEVLWLSMDFKIQKMSYKHTQNKCYKKSAHSKNQRQVYTMSSMRRILSSQQKKNCSVCGHICIRVDFNYKTTFKNHSSYHFPLKNNFAMFSLLLVLFVCLFGLFFWFRSASTFHFWIKLHFSSTNQINFLI